MNNKFNTKLKSSKKAFVELTSFALLTSLILALSLSAYLVVSNIIEQKQISLERDNIEINFKKLNIELKKLQNFEDTSFSYPLNSKHGILEITNSSIEYFSLIDFKSNETTCFDNLCFYSNSGSEVIKLNLDSPYSFKELISLSPGNYQLIFTNIGGNKIDTKFK